MSPTQLQDQHEIATQMHRYALAIDTKNWSLLETVFADEVQADFGTFGVKDVYQGPARGWIEQVKLGIQGMDATQHMMSNHLYEIDGDRATGTTYIRALHICKNDWGADDYTIGGHYEVEFQRQSEGWRISSYRLNVTWNSGNRQVLRAASRK